MRNKWPPYSRRSCYQLGSRFLGNPDICPTRTSARHSLRRTCTSPDRFPTSHCCTSRSPPQSLLAKQPPAAQVLALEPLQTAVEP